MSDQHDYEERADAAAAREVDARAAQMRTPAVFQRAFLSGAEDVTRVMLVRHGQQAYDRTGPVSDAVDAPLSELGRQQARLVAMALSTQRIDHVYASPLQRALDTGREIARHHRLEPTVIEDLREVGLFRDVPVGQRVTEVLSIEVLTGVRERMLQEKLWDVYPLSEPSADFRKRVINAIEGIIATHPGERIVVACHGGVINAYISHVIGSRFDMFFEPAHTSISVVAAGDGRRAIHTLNDTHHLSTAEGDFRTF